MSALGFVEDYPNAQELPPSLVISITDQISVPRFEASGMENWGLIIYSESILLYNERIFSTLEKELTTIVIAHEVAHQVILLVRLSSQLLLQINGKWTAFILRLYPKCCTIYASHSHIHTHTHTPTAIGCHARYQPARQEQSGVRCPAQGHVDTPRVGSNWQPSDCQTTALPPEPYRPEIEIDN